MYSMFTSLIHKFLCIALSHVKYFRFVLFHVATVAISYVFLLFLSPRVVPYYMLVYITVIVAVTHIYRMVDDYGVYKLDFSG